MPRIRGKYELTDFTIAQKLHNQHNWFLNIALYLSLGMMGLLTLAGSYLAATGRLNWLTALLPLGFLALAAGFRFIILPAQYRRVFEQHEELSLPFECDLTHQALIFRNERGSSTLPWMEAVQYRADRHTYLIYRTDTMFHILPVRLFTDEAALNFLQERLRSADIPPARRVFNPIQVLMIILLAVGIFLMAVAVIQPLLSL